jgi:hypothetical protein
MNFVQRKVRPILDDKKRAAVEFGAQARRAFACGRSVYLYGMALLSCTELAGILIMNLRI